MNGTFNEMSFFNAAPETVEDMLKHYDEWGGESTYPHYRCGMGGGHGFAVHLYQAGRVRLWRHAQRHGDPLAEGHQGKGRGAVAVRSRGRYRADGL